MGVTAGADPEELVLRRRRLSPTPLLQEEVARRRSSDAVRSPSVPRAIEVPRLCTEPFSTVYFTQQPSRNRVKAGHRATPVHRELQSSGPAPAGKRHSAACSWN